MNPTLATNLSKALQDESINGYKIIKYLNCGKSAAVFQAKKKNTFYALKVFDNELVERFGHKIQEKRIEQEISLKNHTIPGLVKIYEGGKEQINSQDYHYLIMEFIEGKNLKEFIKDEQYDERFIIETFNSLFHTTEELLKLPTPIVHRDIKPENIMVRYDNQEIILMDLGVLKFVGANSFSDSEEKQFVGTLRYAPPEFLLREEEDSIDGWKAVNYYQIGTVLHDLTQRKELFINAVPYSRLVLAIKEDAPTIERNGHSSRLIQFARNLLSKDWKTRLSYCSASEISKLTDRNKLKPLEKSFEEIRELTIENTSIIQEIDKIQRDNIERRELREKFAKKVKPIIQNCFAEFVNLKIAAGWRFSSDFLLNQDLTKRSKRQIQNFLIQLFGNEHDGLVQPAVFWVRLENDEKGQLSVSLIGMVLNPRDQDSNLRDPKGILHRFHGGLSHQIRFEPKEIYNGIIDLNDTDCLEEDIKTIISGVLKDIIKYLQPEVQDILEYKKKLASGEGSGTRTIYRSKNKLFEP